MGLDASADKKRGQSLRIVPYASPLVEPSMLGMDSHVPVEIDSFLEVQRRILVEHFLY